MPFKSKRVGASLGASGEYSKRKGHDRGQDRRATLSGVNRGDAPERKRATRAQALGELIGSKVLGPGDNHDRRVISSVS